MQIALDVPRQVVGRLIAPCAVLLQGLHDDPVQFATKLLAEFASVDVAVVRDRGQFGRRQRAHPRAGARRIDFPDDPPQFVRTPCPQRILFKWRVAGEELIEQHPQRVNVAPRVDVHAAQPRLLGAHVQRRPHHLLEARVQRQFR